MPVTPFARWYVLRDEVAFLPASEPKQQTRQCCLRMSGTGKENILLSMSRFGRCPE